MEINQRIVLLLLLTVNRGMPSESKEFYSRLASLLSIKHKVKKSQVTTRITTKIKFSFL